MVLLARAEFFRGLCGLKVNTDNTVNAGISFGAITLRLNGKSV
jgi:hypothetical protein